VTEQPNRFQRDIDHWNETGKCLRHFALDTPPSFCEQCGKPWKAVIDGREGRKRRREQA
jgi:rRNA maturation endonuclease Nob1